MYKKSDMKVTVVRKTSFPGFNTYGQMRISDPKEELRASFEEEYDFANPEHRKEIFNRIARIVFGESYYEKGSMDILVEELKSVIHDIDNELPF